MAIAKNDIIVALSGGVLNKNPNASLGGPKANQPVIGTINNLFDNLTSENVEDSRVDYRCVYIYNKNPEDSFYNVTAHIRSQVAGGSDVQIGIKQNTDSQRILVQNLNTIIGSTIDITHEGDTATVNYSPFPNVWAANIRNALNSLTNVSGTTVSATVPAANSVRFEVVFADYKSHGIITIVNNLGGTSTFSVSKTSDGSPINSIAPSLDFATDTPNGVVFDDYDSSNMLSIGHLHAQDFFPIWVKRSVTAGTLPISRDGFVLTIGGNS